MSLVRLGLFEKFTKQLKEEARGQGRQGEHDGLSNQVTHAQSSGCRLFLRREITIHQSNIIVENRIIFRQRLRDEKTSKEDQEIIEIYVVNNYFWSLLNLISFLESLQISSFP